MKFPGYWVSIESAKVVLERTTFDETDLDPETNWKQAWQNQDAASSTKGFVEFKDALLCCAQALALAAGNPLNQSEADQVAKFVPEWTGDRCEIQALSHLLGNID
jgi:hypothetical protein